MEPNTTPPVTPSEPDRTPPESNPVSESPVQPQVPPAPAAAPAAMPATQPVTVQTGHNRSKLRLILPLGLGLLVIIILVVAAFLVFHKSSKPKNTQAAQSASATSTASGNASNVSAAQRNSDNVARQNDAASIAAGVSNYWAGNNGQLPQSTFPLSKHKVEFCGKSCSGGSASTATLSFYDSSKVYLRPYQTDSSTRELASASVVYIIDNAQCKGSNIGARSDGEAAILFALQESSGIKQQCTQD